MSRLLAAITGAGLGVASGLAVAYLHSVASAHLYHRRLERWHQELGVQRLARGEEPEEDPWS